MIGARACFVGSNSAYKLPEACDLLQTSKSKYILFQESEASVICAAAVDVGIPAANIVGVGRLTGEGCAQKHSKKYQSCRSESWCDTDDIQESKTTPAVLLMTSGTTGPPKLAVMSHSAIVAQATMAEWACGDSPAQASTS